MKKTLLVVVLALAVFAGTATAGTKEFWKGGIYVTPQVGFTSWGGIPFGVGAEYAITENIGVGGTIMAQLWSDEGYKTSLITIGAEGFYHFTKIDAQKFDLYAGLGLGYSIVSVTYDFGFLTGGGASGIALYPILGARYWFSPKIAASLKLNGSIIGSYTGFGATIGVTFVLGK